MVYEEKNEPIYLIYGPNEIKLNRLNIIYDKNDPENVEAIEYSHNGNKYYFSNETGHKVYSYDKRNCRPMTKKEFKEICTIMLEKLEDYEDQASLILSEIEKLDFSLGHANSTFEVVCSYAGLSKIGALALNIGTSRYLYNQEANTVYHIDHTKLVNGKMMRSPEKEEIIKKINESKTMTKKINAVLQQ